ncbi:hypothetical protein OS493_011088 [Desmophyllum pertusum]|uniref:Uncharacterized protein n=1 Tax=Desmophyllum pertusum TaxID=174260 RepID=A0A9W9Z1R6_9CNID|nr:hypothetical protein OS493_011088 [Desmophyllum pertusum]
MERTSGSRQNEAGSAVFYEPLSFFFEQRCKKTISGGFFAVDDEGSVKWARQKVTRKEEKTGNAQSAVEELSSNKHLFAKLEFKSKNKVMRSGCKEANESSDISCRRSQRIRLKELKRTHFLFEASQVTTPVNKKREVVLAFETPDQELFALATQRQRRGKRGEIT